MTITANGFSGFKIRRSGTIPGQVTAVDPGVTEALRELDALMSRPLFEPPGGGRPAGGVPGLQLAATLALDLKPRRPGDDQWEAGTLAQALKTTADAIEAARRKGPRKPPAGPGAGGGGAAGARGAGAGGAGVAAAAPAPPVAPAAPAPPVAPAAPAPPVAPDAGLQTLPQIIAEDTGLSQLADQFDTLLSDRWLRLSPKQRVVLDRGYAGLRSYLLILGTKVLGINTAEGLLSFVVRSGDGASRVVDYGAISAARTWIKRQNLNVDFRADDAGVITELRAADLPLSDDAFTAMVSRTVDRFVGDKRYETLLDANPGLFPAQYRPLLIEYLKRAPVELTDSNAKLFIPMYVQQIAGGIDLGEPTLPQRETSDQDFDVQFFTEDRELMQISRSAVKAAAQLYYTMVLGDELQVFDVVNYFTHKYLVGRGFEISDPRLRRDLQMYVFSNQFTVTDAGSKVNRVVDRTQPAERHMFYRQVFNYGGGQVTEDVIVNDEFSRLWKVLMLESAKYLERAQISPHPDNYVSRQNVMQAVEDLQYNLSVHCTGMATVMTPLIYDELNFVTRRILMHEEVRKQVAPVGGSWWKVVETLHEAMRHERPRATALNNKARLGHSILRAIANYDPATFDQDDIFSGFISDVEAFISTQSILQEHLKDALKDDLDPEGAESDEPEAGRVPVLSPGAVAAGPTAGGPAAGEWDF